MVATKKKEEETAAAAAEEDKDWTPGDGDSRRRQGCRQKTKQTTAKEKKTQTQT